MGDKKQPGVDVIWNQTFNKKVDGLDLKKEQEQQLHYLN